MLIKKYIGLPIWVWLVIIGIIFLSCYQTICLVDKAPTLNSKTTENFTAKKPIIKVFNFNTSWCGHSTRFQNEWNKFSAMVKSDPILSHVEAIDVKCDDDLNKSICEQYQVPGYPYIIIEIDSNPIQYNGERTADAILNHILTLN